MACPAGVPLYVVKEILGHSDLSVTQRYAHNDPQIFIVLLADYGSVYRTLGFQRPSRKTLRMSSRTSRSNINVSPAARSMSWTGAMRRS